MSEKNRKTEMELKENLFDTILDIEKAKYLTDIVLNDYFDHAEPTQEVMAYIANRYNHISMILSLCLGLLHDSIKTFERLDMY